MPIDLYVDMTTPPAWDGDVLRAVDLDLDVVRGRTGRVWVDDEDEFAAHRGPYGYPTAVVDLALRRLRRGVERPYATASRPSTAAPTSSGWTLVAQ